MTFVVEDLPPSLDRGHFLDGRWQVAIYVGLTLAEAGWLLGSPPLSEECKGCCIPTASPKGALPANAP